MLRQLCVTELRLRKCFASLILIVPVKVDYTFLYLLENCVWYVELTVVAF